MRKLLIGLLFLTSVPAFAKNCKVVASMDVTNEMLVALHNKGYDVQSGIQGKDADYSLAIYWPKEGLVKVKFDFDKIIHVPNSPMILEEVIHATYSTIWSASELWPRASRKFAEKLTNDIPYCQ